MPKVEKVCENCSQPFLARPVDKRKYCCRECSGAGRAIPLLERTCKECGQKYQLKPYLMKRNNGFCKRSCSQKGENNNSGYKGGVFKKERERAARNKALKFANRPSIQEAFKLVDIACRRAYTRYGKLYLRLCKDCHQQAWINVLQGKRADSGVRLVIDRELLWNERNKLFDPTDESDAFALETGCV